VNLNSVKHILDYMEKDFPELYSHSERTALLCYVLAKELKLSYKEVELCYIAGLLHEIGKLYIPDKIKIKNDLINSDDIYFLFTICILKNYDEFEKVIDVIAQHLENFDGSGIPGNFKEEDINILSRILRICDYYDDHKMKRLIHEDITKLLRKNSNIIFPSKIITPFIKSVIKNNFNI